MDNGLLLIIAFTTPLIILAVYFTWLTNRKKKHAKTLKSDWVKFEKAINYKDTNGIIKFGTELIWNENLTESHLKKMKKCVNEIGEDNSELEDLKNLIYNKWLDWNRDYVGTP